MVHEGIRHSCELCDKSFKSIQSLKEHKISHEVGNDVIRKTTKKHAKQTPGGTKRDQLTLLHLKKIMKFLFTHLNFNFFWYNYLFYFIKSLVSDTFLII